MSRPDPYRPPRRLYLVVDNTTADPVLDAIRARTRRRLWWRRLFSKKSSPVAPGEDQSTPIT